MLAAKEVRESIEGVEGMEGTRISGSTVKTLLGQDNGPVFIKMNVENREIQSESYKKVNSKSH